LVLLLLAPVWPLQPQQRLRWQQELLPLRRGAPAGHVLLLLLAAVLHLQELLLEAVSTAAAGAPAAPLLLTLAAGLLLGVPGERLAQLLLAAVAWRLAAAAVAAVRAGSV
jgi:hypothetical protein